MNHRTPIQHYYVLFLFLWLCCQDASAQNANAYSSIRHCNRGELSYPFCDEDRDLVADVAEPGLDPKTLVVGFVAMEERDTYEMYNPLINQLSKCTGKKVEIYPAMDEYSVIIGMKNANIHIALIPTGLMSMVVNIAGALPFASQGVSSERAAKQTRMLLLVRKDSPYKSLKDLLNKQIAHVSHTSNTGDTVPRAIFTSLEFKPDIDYVVRYSGRHDRSILGVLYGFYDAAAVSGAIFEQMALRGEIAPDLFRTIYTSKNFPVASFTYSSQLNYKLSQKISSCFFNYHFPEEMVSWLGGSDRFYPINYKKDWNTVRRFNVMAGKHFGNAQLEQLRDE